MAPSPQNITHLRIGTRQSLLAMAQSSLVAKAIAAARPRLTVELVPIVTSGDRSTGNLAEVGGKGLFTLELEQALREGAIDLAVHSAKDMPLPMADGLALVAAPRREDPRDVLVSIGGGGVENLPARAHVGTSSLRRSAQLLAIRGDLRISPIRGNVDTRLRKVLEEKLFDATVLAMAGLNRAALAEDVRTHLRPLEVEQFTPAACQGILGVQALASRPELRELLTPIEHALTRQALDAERAVVEALQASCRSSLAVLIDQNLGAPDVSNQVEEESQRAWRGLGMVSRPDGSDLTRFEVRSPSAAAAAGELLEAMRKADVVKMLKD